MESERNDEAIGEGHRPVVRWAPGCLAVLACAVSLSSCAPTADKPPAPPQPPSSQGAADADGSLDYGTGGELGAGDSTPTAQGSDPGAGAAPAEPAIPANSTESSRRVRFLNDRRAVSVTVESLFGDQIRSYKGIPPGGIGELPCGLAGCVLRVFRVDGTRRVDDREFNSETLRPGSCGVLEASTDSISFRSTDCSFR